MALKDSSSRQRQGYVEVGTPALLCALQALMATGGEHREADPEIAGSGIGEGSWEGKGEVLEELKESWALEGLSTRGKSRTF